MEIPITPDRNAQERIDRSQVGDTLIFHGAFHLEEPLIFWSNRDYYGTDSIFYVKQGGIEMRDRPGERTKVKRVALWLDHYFYPPPTLPDIEEEDDEEEDFPAPTYRQRVGWWVKRQLRTMVYMIFWFPRGGLISGFYLHGPSQGEEQKG